MPKCRSCNLDKEQFEFRRNKSYKTGYDTQCRTCNSQYAQQYRKAHPYRYRSNKYGLSEDHLQELLESAKGCEICGDETVRLVVDHDHDTNRYRGLLCDLCNKGIGALKDNPMILRRAVAYLEDADGH